MAGEFIKSSTLTPAVAGTLATAESYNKNLALIAKDSFIPVDEDGTPTDGDLGDETIGTNGTLIADTKVRTGNSFKIYDASGNLLNTVDYTDFVNVLDYTITSFADLSSGSYTTGNYHIATVTTGIFTANYIYLKITTGSGWSEIIPFTKQHIYLVTDGSMYYYTSSTWNKYADRRNSKVVAGGYRYLANGFIEQWGEKTSVTSAGATVTLPLTLPNGILNVQLTPENGSAGVMAGAPQNSWTTTTFYIQNSGASETRDWQWRILGY